MKKFNDYIEDIKRNIMHINYDDGCRSIFLSIVSNTKLPSEIDYDELISDDFSFFRDFMTIGVLTYSGSNCKNTLNKNSNDNNLESKEEILEEYEV